jgi:hypothetical protein
MDRVQGKASQRQRIAVVPQLLPPSDDADDRMPRLVGVKWQAVPPGLGAPQKGWPSVGSPLRGHPWMGTAANMR